MVFDEQKEELRKRNAEVFISNFFFLFFFYSSSSSSQVARLLLVQREELAVAQARAYEQQLVDQKLKQLERQNSLLLNHKIAEVTCIVCALCFDLFFRFRFLSFSFNFILKISY